MLQYRRFPGLVVAFVLVTIFSCARVASAQVVWSVDDALAAAAEYSPELRRALVETQRTELSVTSEEHRYEPGFFASLGYQHHTRQSVITDTLVRNAGQESVTSTIGVEQTFAPGTQVTGSLDVDWTVYDGSNATNPSPGGPHDLGVGVTVEARQPWLRGYGRDVVESELDLAHVDRKLQELERDSVASSVASDVLTAYWELWYAERAVEIQREARAIAQQEAENGEKRVDAGAIADAELIPLLAEVASGEERLFAAESTLRLRAVELARLTGLNVGDDAPIQTDATAPPLDQPPALPDVLERVEANSYELRQRTVDVERSRLQTTLAENQAQYQLDSLAWVRLSGLGGSVPQTFENFDALSVFVGLDLQVPFDNTFRDADTERAVLAVESAELSLTISRDRLRANVAKEVISLAEAYERLELAKTTAELSARSVAVQRERMLAGDKVSFDVVQALQFQREAELRVARSQVDIAIGHVTIDELTGELVPRFGSTKAP